MTLSELINSTTVQGNVRVALFNKSGDEIAVRYIPGLYNGLFPGDFVGIRTRSTSGKSLSCSAWLDYKVTYIFYGNDSYLHIEIESEDD